MSQPPPGITRDYPLARLTTIRAGGCAERFARPATIAEPERLLAWVGAGGTERRTPDQLGFAYRRSSLRPGEVVARASFALQPASPDAVRRTLADMRRRRKEAQPSGIKTFGSTFKNPSDPRAEGRSA